MYHLFFLVQHTFHQLDAFLRLGRPVVEYVENRVCQLLLVSQHLFHRSDILQGFGHASLDQHLRDTRFGRGYLVFYKIGLRAAVALVDVDSLARQLGPVHELLDQGFA